MFRIGKGRRSGSEGVMVVEAAMLMPFFLLFVLFLIFMVQMTIYSTALQSTVSDAVKETAGHWYPIELALQARTDGSTNITGEPESRPGLSEVEEAESRLPSTEGTHWTVPRLSLEEWAGQYASALPSPMDEWVEQAVRAGEGPLQRLQAESSEAVLDAAIKPLLKPYLASDMLDLSRLHVSNAMIPGLKGSNGPYFGIRASYELPMKVPFLNKRIVLEASAVERVWIGNKGERESSDGASDGEDTIAILSVPDPAYRGSKGRIRVKLTPNASASLTIYYKSGKSVAKYLGWKEADQEGYIEWEWTIGGNTTLDSWPEFTVNSESGGTAKGRFHVVKRPG